MSIIEQRKPYEFLARWDHQTGQFKGSHIQYFDAVLRDGVQIAGAPSRAYGVGEGMAFPLEDIVSQMTTDALAAVDAQAATIAERDATIATLTGERDAARAQVAELQALLAPAPVLVPTGEFVLRFTPTEFADVMALAETDAIAAWFIARTRQPDPINVASQAFAGAMQYLVSKGVVTADRVPALSAAAA